eukprot:TRINITY_DN2764_c0_g3_i1.p4 TRINITY_DN2764_c0_g3~~TRINITY_DN2764_c0_g3_i1.p4  ORF type:complete len:137 (-),score=0.43 TRINITY_DN2764_c0_g3_i1:128-538(-)
MSMIRMYPGYSYSCINRIIPSLLDKFASNIPRYCIQLPSHRLLYPSGKDYPWPNNSSINIITRFTEGFRSRIYSMNIDNLGFSQRENNIADVYEKLSKFCCKNLQVKRRVDRSTDVPLLRFRVVKSIFTTNLLRIL